MNYMKIRQIFQVGMIAIFAFLTIPMPVHAEGNSQFIYVEGAFATQQPIPSPLCAGLEDCVVDDLTGDLVGTNRLITLDFTETDQYIFYQDATQIINQYGVFDGEEYGVINKATGSFHSVSRTTSNDGCQSKLTISNSGFIDLETLEDEGTYKGLLKLNQCH